MAKRCLILLPFLLAACWLGTRAQKYDDRRSSPLPAGMLAAEAIVLSLTGLGLATRRADSEFPEFEDEAEDRAM